MWARIILIVWLLASLASAHTLSDFAGLSAEWLRCRHQGYSPSWDLDKSGCVDIKDLTLFTERWLDMSFPLKIKVSGVTDNTWSVLNNMVLYRDGNEGGYVYFGGRYVHPTWGEGSFFLANSNNVNTGWVLCFAYSDVTRILFYRTTGLLGTYTGQEASGTASVAELAYSYQTTKLNLREEVADYLGLGRDKNKWSNEDIARIDSIIRKGLLQFYYPPALGNLPPHQWSFLNPIVSFKTVIGKTAYELAPNFAGLAHPFVMVGADPSVEKIAAVGEGEIRYMQQASPNASGRPKAVAVRPKDRIAIAQQQWEMLIFPKPDAEYTITYSMKIIPMMLDLEDEIPYGCGAHVDTIIASCLAAAEARMNNEKGRMWDDFMERLTASIEQDMQMSRIHYFGYNGDNSDALLNYSRAMARGFTVTVYGQIPY